MSDIEPQYKSYPQGALEALHQKRRAAVLQSALRAGEERDAKFIGWYFQSTESHGIAFTPWYEKGDGTRFYLIGEDQETGERVQYNERGAVVLEMPWETNQVEPYSFDEYPG